MFSTSVKYFYSTYMKHQPTNVKLSQMKKQSHEIQLLLSRVLKPLNLGKCLPANFWTLFLIFTFPEKMSFLSAHLHFSKMPKLYDSANALERISSFYLNTSSSETLHLCQISSS